MFQSNLPIDSRQSLNLNFANDCAADNDGNYNLKLLAEIEAEHIHKVLDHCQGHKGNTCQILGISRPALDRKIERYKLSVFKT